MAWPVLSGLAVEVGRRVPIVYRGKRIATPLKLDLLVEEQVIVEVKAVDAIRPIFLAQVITYLKLTGCPAGLLINFNTTAVRNGIRRLSHPDIHAARPRDDPKPAPAEEPEVSQPWLPPDLL